MERWERNLYCKVMVIAAVYIILAVWFYTIPADAAQLSKKAVFTASLDEVGEFTTEDEKVAKNREIREMAAYDDDSAMPCCDPEAFERWLETYEQETGEEARVEINFVSDSREDVPQEVPTVQSTEVETSAEVETETVENIYTRYSVNGETLNPELQAYLYEQLSARNIEWFMPYAILIAYQESRFNVYAENPNGQDKGLYQFRLQYYPGANIFDPYEQILIFAEQMANRAYAGCDVYEMISRHNQSDYGSYCAEYVSQVLQHEQYLREVKQ